jgi:hypothetical protein
MAQTARASGSSTSGSRFEAPALVAGFHDFALVGEAVEKRGGHLGVAEIAKDCVRLLFRLLPYPERVGCQCRSLRQFSVANPKQGSRWGPFSFYFKGVCAQVASTDVV